MTFSSHYSNCLPLCSHLLLSSNLPLPNFNTDNCDFIQDQSHFLVSRYLIMSVLNINVQVFVWICVISYLGYILRNGIVRSYDNFMFDFWRIIKMFSTVFPSNRVGNSKNLPTSSSTHFIFSFIIVILPWGFDFHFLNDSYELICLCAFCMPSLEKCLFKFFVYF